MRRSGAGMIAGCLGLCKGGRGPEFGIAAVLLCLMLFAGGGGGYSSLTLLLMTAGVPALAVLTVRGWRVRVDLVSGFALGILVLAALTPFLQLVPLPWEIWSGLSGRELAADVLVAIGREGQWMPLSLTPSATLLAGLSLIPAVALVIAALHCTQSQRLALLGIVAASALLSGVLGVLQGAAGASSTAYYLYDTAHAGTALGVFANRNHHADFLLIGMICALALLGWRHRVEPRKVHYLVAAGAIAFLSACVVATNSRTGLALLPLAIASGILFLLPRTGFRPLLYVFGAALALIAALVLFGRANPVFRRTLARFEELDDGRFEFWQDVLFATQQYLPTGSGIGSFDAVFRSIENLSNVTPRYVNNAHNDYLEIALETGVWGAVLVVAFIVAFGMRLWQILRRASGPAVFPARASAAAIIILLLHSLVDYPLRTYTLLAIFSVTCGILFAPKADRPLPQTTKQLS